MRMLKTRLLVQILFGSIMGRARNIVGRKQSKGSEWRARDDIDRQVEARTAELQATIQQLRRELVERERVEMALRFLADANNLIAPSLDYESTLQTVAHLAVPFLCDYCIIDLLPIDEAPRRVGVAHRDPTKEDLLRDLWRCCPTVSDGSSPIATVARTHQPLLLGHVPEPSPEDLIQDDEFLQLIHAVGYPRSWMTAPLLAHGQLLGTFSFASTQSVRRYGPDDLALAEELARRATVAVEHARLYEQAQEVAVLEERQRLAHDLHDAVTQLLFSASLIAQVLPRMWERDSVQGRQALEDLRLLTRGALAEMRALLLELRPTALTSAGLGELLQQLTEALTGRTRIPVALTIEDRRSVAGAPLPPDIQITFYRVAQEALNNISKHADARRVTVELWVEATRVELRIRDDGKGFNPTQTAADHFGLSIMCERIAAIGGSLSIKSQPGQGTEVLARWIEA